MTGQYLESCCPGTEIQSSVFPFMASTNLTLQESAKLQFEELICGSVLPIKAVMPNGVKVFTFSVCLQNEGLPLEVELQG